MNEAVNVEIRRYELLALQSEPEWEGDVQNAAAGDPGPNRVGKWAAMMDSSRRAETGLFVC